MTSELEAAIGRALGDTVTVETIRNGLELAGGHRPLMGERFQVPTWQAEHLIRNSCCVLVNDESGEVE